MTQRARLQSALTLLGLLALAAPVRAASDMIGLYADLGATSCTAAVVPYETVNVYLIATLDRLDTITAAEFRLEGYPGSPGYPLGQCTPRWETSLTIGQLDDDFALAFSTPLGGGSALLGHLEFLAYADSWIGADQKMSVVAGSAKEHVVLVDGEGAGEEHDVLGGRFTFNCSGDCGCGPGGTANASFSELKDRY